MLKKILRGLFSIIGLILGYILSSELLNMNTIKQLDYFRNSTGMSILFIILCTILFGLILFILSPALNSMIIKTMEYFERSIQSTSTTDVVFGTIGGIVGLIVAVLFGTLIAKISIIGIIVSIILAVVMTAFGADIAIRKRKEILLLLSNFKKINYGKEKKNKNVSKATPKVLDTSVIIDGRILDICQTGFIEGTLVIPNFVLEELRHIADSSDDLKRNRGRRGLDILNKIQKELPVNVEIYEKDFPYIAEVDSKLLKLAQVLNGKVITNDYNLNKVAEFQGVPVLNINELSNAVKPMVLPGEKMKIQIVKDGKEHGQGVAYLDDGTMIVVENGRRYIGKDISVVVTSVLQTAAGRMIFAKNQDEI